jgi:site-specific recombinase XerD
MADANDLHLRSFARALRVRNRSPRTIQSYAEAALQLAAFHSGRDLASLSRSDVLAYLDDVRERHKPTTVAVRFRSLQQIYRWMVDEEIMEVSPMAGLRPPDVPDTPVPVLTDSERTALLAACDGKGFEERRDTAIIRVFLDCGLRVAELTGLALDDVDFEQDVVVVLGKGRRPRAVPFGQKTAQALERYLRLRRGHPFAARPEFWIGGRGAMTPSGVAQLLRRRGEQAGIKGLHPHRLRHDAAHRWMAEGGSEGDAMRLFGWRSREMLSRYGSSAAEQRARDAHRRLGLGDRL